MTKRGIDVSKHQGTIDWTKVKASGEVDFAILRAGYGKLKTQKDIQFEANYKNAKAVGIPIGCYWYSYAKTPDEAKTEAQVFLQVIAGKQFEYPVYLDFEEDAQFKTGKSNCTAMAKAFLETVEKAGYYTGVYSSKSGFDYLSEDIKRDYTVWVAHVDVAKTNYAGAYDMWQYSWKGKINGINGDVDCNYCYQDFPTIIKRVGLNGYPKQPQIETPNTSTPETDKNDETEKKKVKVTVELDDHTYSGLLEEI